MQAILKNAILRLFPELSGGLHLDRYGRVLAIADAPGQGASSERFRPRLAADIEILTADMEPDPAFPKYTAVPLPVPMGAGGEAGVFAPPRPGALVVVGFAYGRQDHPIIRQIYGMGDSLPQVGPEEMLLQQGPTTFQRADAGGNWSRETDAAITDKSVSRRVEAMDSSTKLATETKQVSEHSRLEVDGTRTVEVGTQLTMLAGSRADLGTLGVMNLTAGGESTHTTGKNAVETVGGDHTSTVKGNRQINIAGNRSMLVQGADSVTVQGTETIKATGKLVIESGQEILLRAPVIKIQGILTTEGYEGGPGSSTLYGDFTVRQGGVAVPDADVSAGSVSLRGHTHTGVQPGGGTTGTPVGGV